MQQNVLSPDLSASDQISLEQVAEARARGFRAVICNRPDGEATNQPSFADIAAEAGRLGLESRYIPIIFGQMTDADVVAFKMAFDELPKPILGYCGSGKRVSVVAQAAGVTAATKPAAT